MYPYEIVFGMGLYEIFILLGVIVCFIVFRILADRKNFSARFQNLVLTSAFFAIVLGYISAVLTQAVYNALETGTFKIAKDTGATFLGGLIGGAAVFLIIYFIGGKIRLKESHEHIERFSDFTSIAGACISIAHAFGRIGCFFAGCCHGKPTEKWYGIKFLTSDVKLIPVQLFEAIFLTLLFGLLLYLNLTKKEFKSGLYFYMILYGIWRFFAEFMRGDDRGAFFIKALSPSQGVSILLIIAGLVLLVLFGIPRGANDKKENC